MAYVSFENVRKVYGTGELEVEAIKDASFELRQGELVVLVGPSGAGKTTVLNILGGMDTVTSGTVVLDSSEVSSYTKRQLIEYRRQDVGFVFQFYNLVQNLTALENVELASEICRDPLDAAECLAQVGLGDRLQSFPAQLSGGQQQRVAIARALAKNPKLLLCDEPTGALDTVTGKHILGLLQDMAQQRGKTVIVVTHNPDFEALANRVIRIDNGRVSTVMLNEHPLPADELEE